MPEPLGSLSTPWAMIQAAQRTDAPPELRRHCLESLAQRYRDPICSFLICLGVTDQQDRDDLTQSFFVNFLEQDWLSKLDQAKGSFRGLLLVSLRNYVGKERKRGFRNHPASPFTRLSSTDGNLSELLITSKDSDPDVAFNRQWAKQLIEDSLSIFKDDCQQHGLSHYFDVFERHDLHPEKYNDPSYAETAEILACSVRDVRNHLYRARKRFNAVLRELVRLTVSSDEEVDEELAKMERYMMGDSPSSCQ